MKNIAKTLRSRPMDILFLQRLVSIDRHIRLAKEKVSFPLLRSANQRIEFEMQLPHTLDEQEQIALLLMWYNEAHGAMINTLISECS